MQELQERQLQGVKGNFGGMEEHLKMSGRFGSRCETTLFFPDSSKGYNPVGERRESCDLRPMVVT
jgi:hypothetical protein